MPRARRVRKRAREPLGSLLHRFIEWTPDGVGATVQDMCGDHGRADIGLAKQFLNGANIIPRLKKMRSKAMSKRMTHPACFAMPGATNALWKAR